MSFPMSRRPRTRPARRCSISSSAPGSRRSASARTAAISSRSGNRFGRDIETARAYRFRRPTLLAPLRGFDFEDLELQRAARSRDLDGLALLLADDRLADGRLVRQLVLRRVRLR